MNNKMERCGDCGAEEGHWHKPGCDMEPCPFCGGQIISCGCCYKLLNIDISPGTRAYKHGLTQKQADRFSVLVLEKGPIPYIEWPNHCGRCGALWPDMFMVSKQEWEHYIEPRHQKEMVCLDCWNHIKKVIDAHEAVQ